MLLTDRPLHTIAFCSPPLEQPFSNRIPTRHPLHNHIYLHISKVYHTFLFLQVIKFMLQKKLNCFVFLPHPCEKNKYFIIQLHRTQSQKNGTIMPLSITIASLPHAFIPRLFCNSKNNVYFCAYRKNWKTRRTLIQEQEQRCPNATNTWPWQCQTHSLESLKGAK